MLVLFGEVWFHFYEKIHQYLLNVEHCQMVGQLKITLNVKYRPNVKDITGVNVYTGMWVQTTVGW